MDRLPDGKKIYSGIQATGCITIGNYIGAIKNWLALAENNLSTFSIVDLHSLTVRQNPTEFRERAYSFLAQYLACGLNPEKSIIYIQSHVPAHCELTWVLNCFTYLGELQRMTQFKDKSKKHEENINAGLLTYPVLMASDILLYNTELVPVGVDQKQHVEIARDIAIRFNNIYGNTFVVPEPYIPTSGAKIKSLQRPSDKMSKSDPDPNGAVSITDSPDVIMRKFKRAVTDSETSVRYDVDNKPGVSNLLTIYSAFANKTIAEAEAEFENQGYGAFKLAVGDAVVEGLRGIRDNYSVLIKDKSALTEIARQGAAKANAIAERTLAKVHKKIGLILR